MFKLWYTIIKDVRILLRDKVGILMAIIMPVILVVVVTSIQNSTFELMNKNKLVLLVANQDTGKLSPQLIQSIDKIGMFRVKELAKGSDANALKTKLQAKEAELAVLIPKDFTARVSERAQASANKALKSFGMEGDSLKAAKGSTDPINMYYNPVLQEQIRLSVDGALRSALQLVESRETLRDLYLAINDKPLPDTLEREMLSSKTQIKQVSTSRSGDRLIPNASQHNVPAWTIFAMFFIVMSLGGSVVREKVSGSFIRLKTMPTNFIVGLISKQIVYLGVTMFQALVIFSLGVWLFPVMGLPALNIPSDILGLILVTILTGWCAVSYAICVGVFSKTQEQANGFGAVSIVILAAIGGLMVPSYVVSGPMKLLVNFSPLHWCIEAYYNLFLEGGRFADVISNIIPLIGITLLLQAVTVIALKRKNLI
ncbi:ABC transporter permease [Mucilaginibacter myungsuensis]|uniref:ABC transporter permease n=2 Tax=Mucilaginibacter myungsuensis TaxID=649104 RepID=A0A929KZC6_9SPHI|nr:ABC transporter permease [Mucilaginibacter myungsuensis]